MKILKYLIATAGVSGILSPVMVAQVIGPSCCVTASSASESKRLISGQVFSFQLTFNPVPDGYGGGAINYRFQRMDSDLSEANFPGDITVAGGQTDLHDGQAIYTLSLPITDSMSPGTWKLVEITLGRRVQKPVSIRGDFTFEIPPISPVVIHIQAPGSVRAGQRFTIKVTMDEFPKGLAQGCVPMLWGYLHQAWPNGKTHPNDPIVSTNSIELKSDQHSYELSGSFDPDLPNGPWQGEISVHAQGPPPYRNTMRCHSFQSEGNVRFTFTVEPAMGLVTPTSVTVTVNPSQIQLLLAEADRLKAKAEHLKQMLNSENMAANQVLLRNSVKEAMTDLDKTEASYKEKGEKGTEPSYAQAVNVFFNDIRFDYGEVLKSLANDSARLRQTSPRLVVVNLALGGSSPRLNRASEAVLKSILHNARAYDIMASSGTTKFDLEVSSEPKEATVSYRQRLDPEYQTLDHKTDWRIPNLYHATYFIRFQKSGYEEQVITFNGGESTSTSVNVQLVRIGRAR